MLSMLTWLLRQAADVAAELGLSFSQWANDSHMRLLELNDAIRPQQSRQIKHLGPRAPLFMSFFASKTYVKFGSSVLTRKHPPTCTQTVPTGHNKRVLICCGTNAIVGEGISQ